MKREYDLEPRDAPEDYEPRLPNLELAMEVLKGQLQMARSFGMDELYDEIYDDIEELRKQS